MLLFSSLHKGLSYMIQRCEQEKSEDKNILFITHLFYYEHVKKYKIKLCT